MLDFQEFNQILNQNDTKIIIMPQISTADTTKNASADIYDVNEYVPFDTRAQNIIKLKQLSERYQYAQQVVAYAYDDVDVSKLKPSFETGFDVDKFSFVKVEPNSDTITVNYEDMDNFKREYSKFYQNEGQQLTQMWTNHKYEGEADHAAILGVFYNADFKASTIVFAPTNILNQNKYNSRSSANNFIPHADRKSADGYLYRSDASFSVLPVQNTKLFEKYTHQLIDATKKLMQSIPNRIINKYILDGDPNKVNNRIEYDPERSFGLGYHNPVFDEYRVRFGVFNTMTTDVPVLMQEIYMPYVKSVNQYFVLKHSWIANKLRPALDRLDKPTSIAFLDEFVRALYFKDISTSNGNNVDLDDQPFHWEPKPETLNEIQSFEVQSNHGEHVKATNQLTLLNDNSFINQISNLNDSNLYFDTTKPSLTEVVDIDHLDLPLNEPYVVDQLNNQTISNYLESSYHNSLNLAEFSYNNHFKFSLFTPKNMLSHELTMSIGISNVKYLDEVKAKYQNFLSQLKVNFMVNVFICQSGKVYLTALETTNEVNNTKIIYPTNIININDQTKFQMKLNNPEFKSLTNIDIDWNDNIPQVENINVLTDSQNKNVEIFSKLRPNEFKSNSMNETRERIDNRIAALKHDENYQKYISNL